MSKELAAVPYAYAAVVRPGDAILLTAGACPLDAGGVVVGPGDHRAQAQQAVDNLLAVLLAKGAGPEHLVRTTVYAVGSRDDLAAVWAVIAGRLDPHAPPSTLLGVTVLGYPEQLVEIDGIAAVPNSGPGVVAA